MGSPDVMLKTLMKLRNLLTAETAIERLAERFRLSDFHCSRSNYQTSPSSGGLCRASHAVKPASKTFPPGLKCWVSYNVAYICSGPLLPKCH
jgi:hypothetical protein